MFFDTSKYTYVLIVSIQDLQQQQNFLNRKLNKYIQPEETASIWGRNHT